jgi:uncharacterized protein YyaL (SSP411 family)
LKSPGNGATSAPPALGDLFEGKTAKDNEPTIYICENFACQEPVVGAKALEEALDRLEQGDEQKT